MHARPGDESARGIHRIWFLAHHIKSVEEDDLVTEVVKWIWPGGLFRSLFANHEQMSVCGPRTRHQNGSEKGSGREERKKKGEEMLGGRKRRALPPKLWRCYAAHRKETKERRRQKGGKGKDRSATTRL